MTKRHFIALADHIRMTPELKWTDAQLQEIMDFCASVNPRFDRDRWFGYVKGLNGPSGGKRHAA